MAVFDDTLPWPDKLLIYPHEIKWENNIPIPAKGEPERIDIKPLEPLKSECGHFLECIMTGQVPLTDGNEGLRVLRILNACQRSLNENGQGIRLKDNIEKSDDMLSPEDRLFSAHDTAVIDDHVSIGRGTKIWHFSHILSGSVIGEDCTIGQNVVIGPDVSVGCGCKIQNNVSVYKGVTLEENVFCGPSVVFTNVFNPRAHIRRMDELRPTLVKKGASLGANCTIVCGCTVGRFAFVGAGSTVTKDIPDHALVAGNPAQFIRWVCECGEKLDGKLVCTSCGLRFKKVKKGLKSI